VIIITFSITTLACNSFMSPIRRSPIGQPFASLLLATGVFASALPPAIAQAQIAQAQPAGPAQLSAAPVAGTAETVSGKATVTRPSASVEPLKQGTPIREGDTIETAAGGYIYVITVDQGFISLRPNSRLTIDRYRFDAKNPNAAEIRWTLHHGVARVVSGRGIEAAKNRFRMNTPVAAIGVRGTDFSVFSDARVTRASVLSGAIVVSPFNDQCQVGGLGPCAGASGLELIAGQASAAQLRAGDVKPEMLKLPELAPDRVAPPRKDEVPPAGKTSSTSGGDQPRAEGLNAQSSSGAVKSIATELVGERRPFTASPAVHWGRWAAFAGQPANALDNLFGSGKEVISFIGPYGLARDSLSQRDWPSGGKFSFILWNYEAYLMNAESTHFTPAALQNGSLTVDFGNNRFGTSVEFFAGPVRTTITSAGVVSPQGLMYSDPQQAALIRGAVAGTRGEQAGYMFSQPISGTDNSAVGVTRWIR
jgi:hypothetical protein